MLPKVGEATDGMPIYGKWENFEEEELPVLDACGGHFGVTPDRSPSTFSVWVSPPFKAFHCGLTAFQYLGFHDLSVRLKTVRWFSTAMVR